jgi:hypothetical protein
MINAALFLSVIKGHFRTLLAGLIMTDTHQISSFYFDEFFMFLQIERLCDRLQLATRIEDQRDAVRGLKGLSKVNKKIFNFKFKKKKILFISNK